MPIIKELRDFADEYGMIGHRSGSGLEFGDGLQRTFSYFIYRFFSVTDENEIRSDCDMIKRIFDLVSIRIRGEWQPRRHWKSQFWYGKPWTTSRDQLIPLWICLELYAHYDVGIYQQLTVLRGTIVDRNRLWNWRGIWFEENDEPKMPDLFTPFAATIGSRNTVLSLFIDIELVVMSLIINYRSRRTPDNVGDDLNFHLCLIYALQDNYNLTAKLARWIYSFRKKAPGFEGETNIAVSVMKYYFRSKDAPPMHVIADIVLRKFLP